MRTKGDEDMEITEIQKLIDDTESKWKKFAWRNQTESEMLQTIGNLIETTKQQQDEIKDLKQMFEGRGRKIIKLQNELKEQSIFYENLIQD